MRAARRLGAALLAGGVLACAGPPPPPPDLYHRLDLPARAPAAEPLLAGVVEVERPGASDVLRARAMVLADADHPDVLRRSEYHYWVDAPPVLVQDALVDTLRRGGLAGRVTTPESRSDPDWRIDGRLLRFEQVRGGGSVEARVAMELSLRGRERGRPRVQDVYEATRRAPGGSAREGAEATSAALGAVFDAFLADVAAALAGTESPAAP